MKRIILHGVVAGILSAIAGVLYYIIYQNTLGTAFGQLINVGSITGASLFGCVLMASGYALLIRFGKQNLTGWLNILIAILSFISIIGPISMSLPLSIETPELFPGLVVPMHFFPALSFFCLVLFLGLGANQLAPKRIKNPGITLVKRPWKFLRLPATEIEYTAS